MSNERREDNERSPIGRAIVDRVRTEVNDDWGWSPTPEAPDAFAALYLSERDGCLPEEFEDVDVTAGIHAMYYAVLDSLRVELRQRAFPRELLQIVIDPSYEDTTTFIVHNSDRVVFADDRKAWHFFWESEDAMAEELEEWYQAAWERMAPLRYRQHALEASETPAFFVTLHLERVFRVETDNREEALERALRWEIEADDDEVVLETEEVTRFVVEPAEGER